jgi:hypothetical protein
MEAPQSILPSNNKRVLSSGGMWQQRYHEPLVSILLATGLLLGFHLWVQYRWYAF